MPHRDDDITFLPVGRREGPRLPIDEQALVGRLLRKRGVAAFFQGVGAPWRGFAYIAGRPSLWHYGIWPILLNLLISVGVLAVLLFGVKALSGRVQDYFAGWWFGAALAWISFAALVVAAIGLAAAVWFLLQGILCDIFYLRLARRVEIQLGMHPDSLREVAFLADLLDSFVALLALVVVNFGLLFLNCIPVVGSILAAVCSIYFTFWVFGLGFLRFPLVLRGLRRVDRKAFSREFQAQTLGLGAVVFACNLLPLINAILLTSAVAGAVLLHRDLSPRSRGSGRVDEW
jgi:CysZ protein